MNNLQRKKKFLDYLFYDIGKQNEDYWVCGSYTKDNGEIGFSPWITYRNALFHIDFDGISEDWQDYAFFKQISHRSILKNEVVVDLETKDTINDVVVALRKNKMKFTVWETHSRGYHIHIFFKDELSERQKKFIIKKYGGDVAKAGPKVLIACEHAIHWKSGKLKSLVLI